MERSRTLRILPFFTLTQTFHSKIAHFQLTTTEKKNDFFVVYALIVTLNVISESSPTANDWKELCTVLSEKDAC